LSVKLYTQVNCGSRQVVKILHIVNDSFDGTLGKIPSHNTIENWVKKCGLSVYEEEGKKLQSSSYAQVVDESMMIGSEKLLLTLGIPARHQGRPLAYNDVSFLDIAIAESWSGDRIGKRLKAATEKVGHEPEYIISDNASVMVKGIRCTGINHIRDISHSLSMFLERTYKNEDDFKEYLKLMTVPKFKYNMKKIAYLLPPKQRINSRFLNLWEWVEWSSKILKKYHTLSDEEKRVFSFVPLNKPFIEELAEVGLCVNAIESICKNKGLSKQTEDECQQVINKNLFKGNERMRKLGKSISNFLTEQIQNMADKAVINNSSDIIESIFGKYKARKPLNKLNGVTSFILFLPICAKLSNAPKKRKYDFKHALESKKIKYLEEWKKNNLTQNLAQLRKNRLKISA
jgi:hypothetical protein